MAAKSSATLAFFLSLNLLFFSLSSAATLPKPLPSPLVGSPSGGSPSGGTCPIDALRLGICADLLGGLLGIGNGIIPPRRPCCSLIQGLLDLEAAVCICAAIRANVLGINLNVRLALSLLLNVCGKNVPAGFQCA